ncbi:MAG: hypothetical protein RQ867_09210 [Mariprofundaceae bacterium]|nr:hypothetical protein [Mariprofundaceae bacterium]
MNRGSPPIGRPAERDNILYVLKSRAWAYSVRSRLNASSWRKLGHKIGIDHKLLEKVARGERSPENWLHVCPEERETFATGPRGVGLWKVLESPANILLPAGAIKTHSHESSAWLTLIYTYLDARRLFYISADSLIWASSNNTAGVNRDQMLDTVTAAMVKVVTNLDQIGELARHGLSAADLLMILDTAQFTDSSTGLTEALMRPEIDWAAAYTKTIEPQILH